MFGTCVFAWLLDLFGGLSFFLIEFRQGVTEYICLQCHRRAWSFRTVIVDLCEAFKLSPMVQVDESVFLFLLGMISDQSVSAWAESFHFGLCFLHQRNEQVFQVTFQRENDSSQNATHPIPNMQMRTTVQMMTATGQGPEPVSVYKIANCRRNWTERAFLRWTKLITCCVAQVALAYCCAFLRNCSRN